MIKSRRKNKINMHKYDKFVSGEIFSSGFGFDGNEEIRWVGVKLANGKWMLKYKTFGANDTTPTETAYLEKHVPHWYASDDEEISVSGITMGIQKRASRLIDCDAEVMSLFNI